MEGDAIPSVQPCEHRKVAELRWDGATELIRGEGPERTIDAMTTMKMHHIHRYHKKVKSEL